MSEVKVNKLSPRSGTTVTIGDSGDTINVVGTLQNNGTAVEVDSVTFKEGGTNFTNSLLVGTDSTGTLDAATGNTGVGVGVFAALTSGDNNIAVGLNSLAALTTGTENTAVGSGALDSNTTGGCNVAIGADSLSANTTASRGTAIGRCALASNTDGDANTAVGDLAMEDCTTGDLNTAIGTESLKNLTTGCYNVALGRSSAEALTTANSNTALGYQSLKTNTTGCQNVAVGTQALENNDTGCRNVAVGLCSLFSIAGAGNENTGIGYGVGCAITTGDENALLGYRAGFNITTGSCNIAIGPSACTDAGETSNSISMGYAVVSIANAVTFGSGSTDSRIAFGATSITAPSDQRLKEDIQDDTAGLSFINDLRPVTYRWRKEKDIPAEMRTHVAGSEKRYKNDKVNHGFIAQEVKQAIDNHPELKDGFDMWAEEDTLDGRQRIAEGALIPMLVNAIKELKARIEVLENE